MLEIESLKSNHKGLLQLASRVHCILETVYCNKIGRALSNSRLLFFLHKNYSPSKKLKLFKSLLFILFSEIFLPLILYSFENISAFYDVFTQSNASSCCFSSFSPSFCFSPFSSLNFVMIDKVD